MRDADERLVVREIRQGKTAVDSALVDLAQAAERRGDTVAARELYGQALRRSPRSWKAARGLAELHRHGLENLGEALRLYEQAAANAPSRGADRALIFREWGMLLKDSGGPQATEDAIEKFETALVETPNDVLAIDALARMLDRKGVYRKVIDLLAPHVGRLNDRSKRIMLPLLLKAYERSGEAVKAAELRQKMEEV